MRLAFIALSLLLAAVFATNAASISAGTGRHASADQRGAQFFGSERFEFANTAAGTREWTSPEIVAGIDWTQLVVSWNATTPGGSGLDIEARALFPDHATKFFVLGRWASGPGAFPRASVRGQRDADGDVRTDTLELARPARRLQLRVILHDDAGRWPELRFLGASVLDARAQPPPLPPNRAAWGRVIDVPRRSQMIYAEGGEWCSPASMSMVLAWWARRLNQPELDLDVPQVAAEVHDPNWPGTGNWPFNTAFAGSFGGLRACVTRLSDVSELEDWIAARLPVVVSVDYGLLQGKGPRGNGHLVVVVGFTRQGDVVVNDPGTRHEVRRSFPRANLERAWECSHRTAYLIWPETHRLPRDRFGHW